MKLVKRGAMFLKVAIQNLYFGSRYGINSEDYWDSRFKINWVSYGGRLQTALFAIGFISTRPQYTRRLYWIMDAVRVTPYPFSG